MDKKTFVEQRLIYVVKALFPRVSSLEYRNYNALELVEEVKVEIEPAKGRFGYLTLAINVTGDSLIALTRDVLKKLEEKL